MFDQLLAGVRQHHFLDNVVLMPELQTIKAVFSKPDVDDPAYMRTQAQSIVQSVGARWSNALADSQLARYKMVDGIKRVVISRVDYRAVDGAAIASNGYRAVWTKAHLAGLLEACRCSGIQIVSYHMQTAWVIHS